jgi:hypothetical protein
MVPNQVALLRLQQKQLWSGWKLIQDGRRITIDSVATALGCSHGLAYSIMHDHWKFWKVYAWWVPRELKDREKINRMGLSLQHLIRYAYEGEEMLNRTVTWDESWVHHYQHNSKRASVQCKHPSSASAKMCKVMSMPSAGTFMFTVFWDSQGVLLAHFQKCGENVNSALYYEVLLKLQDAICRKHPGHLARRLLLHHGNTRPQTA